MHVRPRLVSTLVATLVAAAALAGGGAPASAASGTTTSYPVTWAFGVGDVAGSLSPASSARIVDQTTYDDKVNAVPTSGQQVSVNSQTCGLGSAYASGLAVWGAGQWVGLKTLGVRLQLACLNENGELHRYNWGVERLRNGNYVNATNCVQLERLDTHRFTLKADAACKVQDEVLDPKPSRQLSAVNNLSIPFTATITISGAAYPTF